MVEITSEEKTKLFEKLPKELRDFMESENTGAFLLYLGGKYKLSDDKVSLLSKLVGDVVLGITPITSLAQEINLKIATDSQTAMNLAQELYADLLSPVMSKTPVPPQTSIEAPAPQMPSTPTPMIKPAPQPVTPLDADRYREPTNEVSGIVDLRKMPLPVRPAPIPAPPMPPMSKPAPPLTFIKPVEPINPKPPIPLIEAEPHLPAKVSTPPPASQQPPQILPRETLENKPQYIIRPPGLAPTDLPRNILDLKKDKGEF